MSLLALRSKHVHLFIPQIMDNMTYSRELAQKVFNAIDVDKNGVIDLLEWNYANISYFWNCKEGDPIADMFGKIE